MAKEIYIVIKTTYYFDGVVAEPKCVGVFEDLKEATQLYLELMRADNHILFKSRFDIQQCLLNERIKQ